MFQIHLRDKVKQDYMMRISKQSFSETKELNRISDISERNRSFWDELCGTQLAKFLGISDATPESLKRFDDWYMDFYPYLQRHVPFNQVKGKVVLEVGLGYGTVSQKLAESGACYHGLDIAENPVRMVQDRLSHAGLVGEVQQGSILAAPYADSTFDLVVAIGCYHHTGDLAQALDETWRLLKTGGQAIVMVYYAYSYRRWFYYFRPTVSYLIWDKWGIGSPRDSSEIERNHYDKGEKGAAPETVFVSRTHMKRMTEKWHSRRFYLENIGSEGVFRGIPRKIAIQHFGNYIGLDVYCHLTK
jgi:SAM-dependent methyltransferase